MAQRHTGEKVSHLCNFCNKSLPTYDTLLSHERNCPANSLSIKKRSEHQVPSEKNSAQTNTGHIYPIEDISEWHDQDMADPQQYGNKMGIPYIIEKVPSVEKNNELASIPRVSHNERQQLASELTTIMSEQKKPCYCGYFHENKSALKLHINGHLMRESHQLDPEIKKLIALIMLGSKCYCEFTDPDEKSIKLHLMQHLISNANPLDEEIRGQAQDMVNGASCGYCDFTCSDLVLAQLHLMKHLIDN